MILCVFIGMILTVLLIEGYHASIDPSACVACHSMSQVGASWHLSF